MTKNIQPMADVTIANLKGKKKYPSTSQTAHRKKKKKKKIITRRI